MLHVAAEHVSAGTELQLTLRALVAHVVALIRAFEFHFAGGGETETLLRRLFGF